MMQLTNNNNNNVAFNAKHRQDLQLRAFIKRDSVWAFHRVEKSQIRTRFIIIVSVEIMLMNKHYG